MRGLGDLTTASLDGKNAKPIVKSWNAPQYDWSPDGKWFAYALADDDFNNDVWIVPSDASKPAVNVSRHPDNDGRPVWSPDGKLLAFTGRRDLDQSDIHYIWLRAADDEATRRERTLNKALDKMQKGRKPAIIPNILNPNAKGAPPVKTPTDPPMPPPKEPSMKTDPQPAPDVAEQGNDDQSTADQVGAVLPNIAGRLPFVGEKKPVEVKIDFDGLHDRVHRLTIANVNETNLVWSPDGKKLAFGATIEGKAGIYAVEFPDNLKPTLFAAATGGQPIWIDAGLVMNIGGAPTLVTSSGSTTPYRFNAKQSVDRAARHAAIFDQCWRTMRDRYYDERLGNRNWDAVRRKYLDAARDAYDMDALTVVIQLMLGELNGSHLGFTVRPEGSPLPDPNAPPATPAAPEPTPGLAKRGWNDETAHLGVRFDPDHAGPGWKIRDVLPHGPAARDASRLRVGEVILSVDGRAVDPALDATLVLNGPPDRSLILKVKDRDGKERTVALRPTTYAEARRLLYDAWVETSRATVEKLTGGKFGYMHIAGMNMPSFYKFEEELASIAYGKEGLVIDVRENGGGSTTDHLLTILAQPRHAITVPRGGGQGYPQDRIVYATWNKPIVVLCNQNSFSNAEIFSHAIKTLKRGKVVGVPTAGGVISTGAVSIFDIGTLRMPFRGWYHPETGEDMELNGAVPDVIVAQLPGDLPRGKDAQLEAAIDALQADVKTWNERKTPKLKKAMER
ncbi:MAG: S41 family peptidase [Pirellulales bacterium]